MANATIKFDIPLVGTDVEDATKKIQEGINDARYAAPFSKYNDGHMKLAGNVVTEKDGSLHYVGTGKAETERDANKLQRFLSDAMEFSGIRKWPEREGFAPNKELKDLVAAFREDISDLFQIPDNNYNGNKERLDYLTREELGDTFGDRDLAHRDTEGVITFGSSLYNHGLPDGKAIERRDIYLEKGGKTYKMMSNDEIYYNVKSHQMNIEVVNKGANTSFDRKNVAQAKEDIFNCQDGKPMFIDSGSYLTISDDYRDVGLFDVYTPEEFDKNLQVVNVQIPEQQKGDIKYYFGDYPDTFGTLENTGKVTTARMTIGVMSGYNVKNPSDKRAMELAECAVKEVKDSIFEGAIPMPDIELKPAMTEYLPEWGCPEGGEKCIQVDFGPMEKDNVALFAMGMQAALDQSTVTVNFGDGENLYITRDEDKYPHIEIFSSMQYDIPLVGNDAKEAGKKIQAALQEYGKTHDDPIYATGAVVTEKNGSLHYVGSQNVLFCKDKDKFADALSDMLDISGIEQEVIKEVKSLSDIPINERISEAKRKTNEHNTSLRSKENKRDEHGERGGI